jgi:3-deoxy-7-phosphoheptulonate synthase
MIDADATAWTPRSWQQKPQAQQIPYAPERKESLDRVLGKLTQLPPLVTPQEVPPSMIIDVNAVQVHTLRQQLAEVCAGKRFLLQGGDCAELFDYCTSTGIENKIKVLLQMSLIVIWGGRIPVVRIARMAGQVRCWVALCEVYDASMPNRVLVPLRWLTAVKFLPIGTSF